MTCFRMHLNIWNIYHRGKYYTLNENKNKQEWHKEKYTINLYINIKCSRSNVLIKEDRFAAYCFNRVLLIFDKLVKNHNLFRQCFKNLKQEHTDL